MTYEICIYESGAALLAIGTITDAPTLNSEAHKTAHLVGCTNTIAAHRNFLEVITDKAQAETAYQILREKSSDLKLLWRGNRQFSG